MKLKVGIIGLGYWGPNYLRNFIRHEQTDVLWGCDLSEATLKKIANIFPQVKLTKDYLDIINDPSVDIVAIATPPKTHYKIALATLKSGKNVLVAKPLATKTSEVQALIKIAEEKGLLLHCDLTYLYTGAINEIKSDLERNIIGQPLYYDSTRTNLGLIQNDINVIWDLAPHDLSIINYCFGFQPQEVYTIGSQHHANSIREEMAHITIKYTNNFIAHIHVSWISPVKLRTILIGGTKKMIFYDDVQPDEKIRIYDKSVTFQTENITTAKPVYRNGNIVIPKLKNEEALFVEINDLVEQINKKKINYKNANLNVEIITLLEACDESLRKNKPVNV